MFFRGEYFFLSNMFPCQITFNGLVFLNAEAAFQAQKTTERKIQKQFCELKGKDAKRKGRKIQLRSNWEAIKVSVMRCVVFEKFKQNKHLIPFLKNIKGDITEDNIWHDTFWGKCNGVGRNELGKILMEVRNNL